MFRRSNHITGSKTQQVIDAASDSSRSGSNVIATSTKIDGCSTGSSIDESETCSTGSSNLGRTGGIIVDINPTSAISASSTLSVLACRPSTNDKGDNHDPYGDIDITGNGKYNHSKFKKNGRSNHVAMLPCIGVIGLFLLLLHHIQQQHRQYTTNRNQLQLRTQNDYGNNMYHLRTTHQHSSGSDSYVANNKYNNQCRWYLAESAIPQSGLGIYTGIPLQKGDMIGYPDICIYVADGPQHWTHLRSHTFGRRKFFGQYEGMKNRAACEGLVTTVNTVPDSMINMELVSPILPTNAGLHRATSPGAGAITHHFGIYGKALDTIIAGSEITINYGDWDFNDKSNDRKTYPRKPIRDIDWLQLHGWCIDYITIDVSSIPHAGRGAFARVPIPKGTVVAPAPLLVFNDRSIFKTKNYGVASEQLFVNYCIQPESSNILLFPYGQGVNLINHSKQPNVEIRWATNTRNKMHHSEYLDLSTTEFFDIVTPGSLIIEVVAIRKIEQGEELLLNYGQSWEDAWSKHINNWTPVLNATQYVYPSEMDETAPVRTVQEQVTNPYPNNLITMCRTHDRKREDGNHLEWVEPVNTHWAGDMVYCHILERKYDKRIGDDLYTVSLLLESDTMDTLDYDLDTYKRPYAAELYIDYKVPRRAIRFIEKPYVDDEHLRNVFRHPIVLSDRFVPESWRNTS